MTGQEIAEYSSHSFAASHGALSPDGMTLATVGVNELKLWDVKTGKLQFTPQGIHGHTCGIAYTRWEDTWSRAALTATPAPTTNSSGWNSICGT